MVKICDRNSQCDCYPQTLKLSCGNITSPALSTTAFHLGCTMGARTARGSVAVARVRIGADIVGDRVALLVVLRLRLQSDSCQLGQKSGDIQDPYLLFRVSKGIPKHGWHGRISCSVARNPIMRLMTRSWSRWLSVVGLEGSLSGWLH